MATLEPGKLEWQKVTELFHQALELPPTERTAFLRTANNEALQQEVQSLLLSYDEASDFLETPITPSLTDAAPKAPPALVPGDKIGDFEILRTLGSGSFATVYLARQLSLGRQIALKVSPDFGEEARRMATLEHDNIVTVFSQSTIPEASVRLLCMQYVPGVTLEVILQRLSKIPPEALNGARFLQELDSLSATVEEFNPAALQDRELIRQLDYVETVLWFGARVAQALAYAHEKGVLHLDVKPENILISQYGRPLLADFNISVVKKDHARILGGTLNYMAPEHRKVFEHFGVEENGIGVDHRSDLYSLGLVLKKMFETGKVLSENSVHFVAEHPDLEQTRHEIEELLRLCLEEKPSDRFVSAGQLRNALESCFERRSIAKELPLPRPLRRFEMRYPIVFLCLGTIFANVMGSAVNISYNLNRIVNHLTPRQQEFFEFLIVAWNPIVYSICCFFAFKQLMPFIRYFTDPGDSFPLETDHLDKLRQHVMALPISIGTYISAGWLASAVFFPVMLVIFRGPIDKLIIFHLITSFLLSWLIALTYNFLWVQAFGLRALYFRFGRGCRNLRTFARRDLECLGPRLRLFHFLAGLVPNIAALLLLEAGPDANTPASVRTFKFLIQGLIAIGVYGFLTGFRGGKESTQTSFALKGLSIPKAI